MMAYEPHMATYGFGVFPDADHSLQRLEDAWNRFHTNKDEFVKQKVQTHFNIPKVHAMQHYVHIIRSHGTADGTGGNRVFSR